ncbi:MAG: CtsR family transcriptional regulator [Tissierellia bacterium]|nr:CtsR family transcriptional regulator [Tissierellia bacterium]
MAALSTVIEEFLKQMLEDNDGIFELRRNELAGNFNCSPSQINYVLETRFQPSMGYYIESRRGGGGYIKIVKVEMDSEEEHLKMLDESIGTSLTLHGADAIIDHLYLHGFIKKNERALLKAAMEDRSFDVKGIDKNRLRSSVLRNMLLALARDWDYNE